MISNWFESNCIHYNHIVSCYQTCAAPAVQSWKEVKVLQGQLQLFNRGDAVYASPGWPASLSKRSLEQLGPHAHSDKMSPVQLVRSQKVRAANINTLCTMLLCKMLMLNDPTGHWLSTDTCYRTVIEHFISAQLHQD